MVPEDPRGRGAGQAGAARPGAIDGRTVDQLGSGPGPPPSQLVRLGATLVGKHQIRGHRWTVMQDPEGNEFCIAVKSFTGLTEQQA